MNYFLQEVINLTYFQELFESLITIIFEEFVTTFFQVLIFDVFLGIFNKIFFTNAFGLENPLAFGFFLICCLTAVGILWYQYS